ncbi:MAG: 4-alpha-glucanotransferase [Gemmatimonadetes bacterium]|nr:4-alpha-glucanotransferase [Gemmatimonadota bacterium]
MTADSLLDRRSAGILLHPSSLPGPGIGTIGGEALAFIDALAEAGQSAWQILPLVAVDEGGSPYSGVSAFGANPLLIDLRRLVSDGLLEEGDAVGYREQPGGRIDYPRVTAWKQELLGRAFRAFRSGAAPQMEGPFAEFCRTQAPWLDDFSLFMALRNRYHGGAWTGWDQPVRDRDPEALAQLRQELQEEIELHQFQQFLFDRQWQMLREHARRRGVAIIGDLPIFVAHDSADVWANRELFELDDRGEPVVVSGVPPDYFSETGQRWGNPLYRWQVLLDTDYDWWARRFQRTLQAVDIVRIDHFRGFEAYWEVPGDQETALNGRWVPGPGRGFFDRLAQKLGLLPVIAEDLGLITREVEELRDALGFPGMRVLQFAFDGDASNPHLPENYTENSVAYTGTHDNDTVRGWWDGATPSERVRILSRIPAETSDIHWQLISLVASSRARLTIFPAQDLLGVGNEARMNTPGTAADNWSWRFGGFDGSGSETLGRMRDLTRETGRLASADVAQGTP